jgi:hypothetical protein
MSTGSSLTATEREELLRRSWMATDGLWFYQTAQALGLDGANEANIQVVREFARQEMRRLMRALGIENVKTTEQYHELIRTATELYLGSLFASDESIHGDAHEIEVTTCFAYKGVKRAGIEKEYHCGPGERLTGWLQSMGLSARIEPDVGLCQMAHTGKCHYRIKLGIEASR